MPRPILHSFTSLLLLLGFISCEARQAEEKPTPAHNSQPSSVWLVQKDGRKLYLGGTIHLLREEDYPLPAVFERAYQNSTKVVFELPPGSDKKPETAQLMQALGMYAGDQTIQSELSPETLEKIQQWAAHKKQPLAAFSKLRPWMLALTIASVEYQRIGAQPDMGVDNHFEKRVSKDGKASAGLESVEFQLGIFAGLNPKLQEELLLQTLSETETIGRDFQTLLEAWKQGDADQLQAFLFKDADKYPELMEQFLIKRNKSWVEPIMQLLNSSDTALVLVGAGHIGGKDGLIDLLTQQGCTVSQLQ